MLNEPLIVESALVRPHMCAGCRATTGPFLDTAIDALEMDGRLYLCMLCLRRYAAAAGFAQGERMDALVDAKSTVEYAEQETAKRNDVIAELRKVVKARDASIVELQALVERLEGDARRQEHLASLIQESARELAGA